MTEEEIKRCNAVLEEEWDDILVERPNFQNRVRDYILRDDRVGYQLEFERDNWYGETVYLTRDPDVVRVRHGYWSVFERTADVD